jgi:hypothetical protein
MSSLLNIVDNAVPVFERVTINSIKVANGIVGGLSSPSKMPGYGYSLPAKRCLTGAKLAKVEGSVCSGCYALKGHYVFPKVQECLEKRYQATMYHPQWVEAMAYLINKRAKKHPHFRWHDSGDIQSVEHLNKIVSVCLLTPTVKHWIPTREYKMVEQYLAAGFSIPENLCIRLSAHMVGNKAPNVQGLTTSTVDYHAGVRCPAQNQGNSCGDCRACWDTGVANVDYHKH